MNLPEVYNRNKIILELRKTHTLQEIGDIYGITKERVRQICNTPGLYINKNRERKDFALIKEYAKTHSIKEVTEKFNVSNITLKRYNIKCVKKVCWWIKEQGYFTEHIKTNKAKELANKYKITRDNVYKRIQQEKIFINNNK